MNFFFYFFLVYIMFAALFSHADFHRVMYTLHEWHFNFVDVWAVVKNFRNKIENVEKNDAVDYLKKI